MTKRPTQSQQLPEYGLLQGSHAPYDSSILYYSILSKKKMFKYFLLDYFKLKIHTFQ